MRNALFILTAGVVLVGAVALSAGPASARGGGKTDPPDKGFDELKGMLLDRPEIPVTDPRGYEAPLKKKPDLPAEGVMIVDATGRLARDEESGWPVILFKKDANGFMPKPRQLLPCRLLEQMERIWAEQPDAEFRISGETLRYKDKMYLLLRKVVYIDTPAPPASRPPTGAVSPKPSPATQAAATAAKTDTLVSPDEIMLKLMQDRPGKPVIAPIVPPSRQVLAAPSVAPSHAKPVKPGRGAMAVDRLVRIVPGPGSQWMMVRFEADNTLQEPPLRLLPCRNLQAAENYIKAAQGRPVKFRITGEITFYRGKRHLLLRKLIPERDMGQL